MLKWCTIRCYVDILSLVRIPSGEYHYCDIEYSL